MVVILRPSKTTSPRNIMTIGRNITRGSRLRSYITTCYKMPFPRNIRPAILQPHVVVSHPVKRRTVFKKGSRKNPANYRPISLTSIPCKIFEHIISSSVYTNTLSLSNSILCDAQHGFRKNLLCETQLITTIHDLIDLI